MISAGERRRRVQDGTQRVGHGMIGIHSIMTE